MLVPTPAVRNLIREGKIHQIPSVIQTGSAHGMQSMDAALATLVRAGRITTGTRRGSLVHSGGASPSAGRRRARRVSTYTFKAMDLAGAPLRGQVEAESKQAVSDQLRQRGLVILDIAEKHASRELNMALFERITLSDLSIFSRQLSTMVSSGMTILRALFVLEEQTEIKKLKAVIVTVRKDVEAGLALSVALSRHPKVFSPLFVSMIRAGEIGGVLEDSLVRIADQLEKEESLRRQVKSAMVYPAVVISVAVIVMVVLVVYIVPVFAGVLKQFATTASGAQLPMMTQVTVDVSHAVTGYWYAFIVGGVAIAILFRRWKRSDGGAASGTASA